VESSNPVLTRLGDNARQQRGSGGFGAGPDVGTYGVSPVQATRERMMSLDDVVVRTIGLLVLTGVAGAISWVTLPEGPAGTLALAGSAIVGLVLGLVIAFKQVTNPFLIGAYAVVEGVLLGVLSRYYESAYNGIVIQAVVGTFGVFFGMAALYKFRVLRATPKFARFVIGALIGVIALMLVNWLLAAFFHINLGLRANPEGKVGALPIIFSLVIIAVGALTFILDFDLIEKGVRYGLPERYAWYCAFGLLVGLIFLYVEILRLLGNLRR
jgi:uncharacterized YccA/Bax inhibitor family protein